MRNWTSLIPNLSSWINAFLLATLLIIATSLIPAFHYLFNVFYLIFVWVFYFLAFVLSAIVGALPSFLQYLVQYILVSALNVVLAIVSTIGALLSPLVLLLPIAIIAFAHHYFYLLLDRYYPDLSENERGRMTGYLPGITSWWHGLFALLVIIMAMLLSDSILSIFPWLNNVGSYDSLSQIASSEVSAMSRVGIWVRMALMILGQPIYRPLMRLVIWFVAAAYIYQFEFNFRQHLIDTARRN